ncbi:MAG: cytochrome d ubiquinol oxidase subunit II, partial [Ktedonobacterales bacterium]
MLIDSFTLADGMAVVLWLAVMAFAVLGGADFGAGVWDLLARGRTAEQQRGALIRAIGPIWEANEIWLIFLVTGAFTAFPLVFSSIMTALFVPLALGLLGMVLR